MWVKTQARLMLPCSFCIDSGEYPLREAPILFFALTGAAVRPLDPHRDAVLYAGNPTTSFEETECI